MLLNLILTESGRDALAGVASETLRESCAKPWVHSENGVVIATATTSFPTSTFNDGRRIHEVVTHTLRLASLPDGGPAEYVHEVTRERVVDGVESLTGRQTEAPFRSRRVSEVIEQIGASHLTDAVHFQSWLSTRERAAIVEYTALGTIEYDFVLQAAAKLHPEDPHLKRALGGGVCERMSVARRLHDLANEEAHSYGVSVPQRAA